MLPNEIRNASEILVSKQHNHSKADSAAGQQLRLNILMIECIIILLAALVRTDSQSSPLGVQKTSWKFSHLNK